MKHHYIKTYHHSFKEIHVFLLTIGIAKQHGGNLVYK